MGNASAKFDAATLGTPTPLPKEKCFDGKAPPKVAKTYTITPEGFNITEVKKDPCIKVYDGETFLFMTKTGPFTKTQGGKESKITDAAGKLIAITKFKTEFGGGRTRMMKPTATWKGQESTDTPWDEKETPVYNFAKTDYKMAYTDKCTYSLYTADGSFEEVYIGLKISTMNFKVVVQTPDGTVVAKVKKGSGGKYEAEVAAGVDLIPIIAIAQACVGGGNSAGALAGAGVI